MRRFNLSWFGFLLISILACGGGGASPVEPLTGPYLGQQPPGLEPVLFASGVVTTGAQELSIAFSPNGEEVFFFATGPAYNPRFILHSRLEGGVWTTPREAPFTDPGRTDSYPFVSPDGSKVFFCSGRQIPGANRSSHHHEIWFVEKAGLGWGESQKIDFGGDLGGVGTFPSVAANGNLYFNGSHDSPSSDIYVSRYENGRYATPENLGPAVNSDAGDFHPFISPDESYILFDSIREEDSFGGNDLFFSIRLEDGSWSPARNLGSAVNTPFGDMRPFVTADRAYLFFASSRPAQDPLPPEGQTYDEISHRLQQPGNGLQDIYWVSAEVLKTAGIE